MRGFRKLEKVLPMSYKFNEQLAENNDAMDGDSFSEPQRSEAHQSEDSLVARVNQVARSYQIYEKPQDRLKQFLWRGRRQFYREFWALHPVSFDLYRGECLGFVGRNGAGKSTLLQILAGTLMPTVGEYIVNGRVAALLELGSGFNMEFTGRENVYLNASIMGLTRKDIESRFAEIEDFAEVGTFIDQPVKTYSSGMYIRLAFSVAIHLNPEVLLVDEALSVGDAAFQHKCLRKIQELRAAGMSIIFVTHDTLAVKRFCTRAGWLHDGRLVALGDAVEVTHQYEDFVRQRNKVYDKSHASIADSNVDNSTVSGDVENNPHLKRGNPSFTNSVDSVSTSNHPIEIIGLELLDGHGAVTNGFITGADMRLRLNYRVSQQLVDGFVVGVAIFRSDDLYVCGLNTALDDFAIVDEPGEHSVTVEYPRLSLLAGTYYFKVGAFDSSTKVRWDFRERCLDFSVSSPYIAEGVCVLEHSWNQ